MAADEEMFFSLVKQDLPVLPVATKTDKIGKGLFAKNVAEWRRRLNVPELSVLPYSSVTGAGRDDFLDTLWNSLV